MGGQRKQEVCYECGKDRDRCKVAYVVEGNEVWVCPQCWRDLHYDDYLYEHRQAKHA